MKSTANKPLAEPVRQAYLDALGVEVWRPRAAADELDLEIDLANDQDDDIESVSGAAVDPCPDTPGTASRHGDEAAAQPLTDWSALQAAVASCTRCVLHETRTQTVFGVGNASADILVIGEAPGAEEDRRGEPFVGRAGRLLDEMLRAIGLDRDTVYIANMLKCRPPGNRDPAADEAASCRRYLDRQIELLAPRIILAVGRIAAQQLLQTEQPLGRLRGQTHTLAGHDLPVVVTYHPAYLLRSPAQKRKAWQDLCRLRDLASDVAA